jgi:hypothetical protein
MDIQLRSLNGALNYYDNFADVVKFVDSKDIEKISFDNPKTQKKMRILYDDEKDIWIQAPLYYNAAKYNPDLFENMTEINKKIIASFNKIDAEYETYQEYTKEELKTLLLSL